MERTVFQELVQWKNKKRVRKGLAELPPLYTAQDAIDCIEIFKSVNYDEIIEDDLVKRLTRAFCLDIGRRCYNCIEEEGIAKFDNYIEMRKESMK